MIKFVALHILLPTLLSDRLDSFQFINKKSLFSIFRPFSKISNLLIGVNLILLQTEAVHVLFFFLLCRIVILTAVSFLFSSYRFVV